MRGLGGDIARAAGVADQQGGLAAPAQLGGERQRREHVAAGAAGRDHHRPHHAITSTLGRRRVSARNSPMPSASAHSDEPP